MSHRDAWSVSLGRWGGVHVRLHMFFLLFALFTVYLAWQDSGGDGLTSLALLSTGILLVSVLAHEIAHYLAATRLGGSMDTIELAPLGGLRPIYVPHDPQSELLAILAGPMASLGICLFCLMLVAAQDHEAAFSLLHPLAPRHLTEDAVSGGVWSWGTIVRLTCWTNWWLVVVNLIPAFPFDGGRACQAFILAVRPNLPRERAVTIVAVIARLVAVGLLLLAIVFRDTFSGTEIPLWLPLMLLSIFVFFAAGVEESQAELMRADEELFGYDFSQGYTSFDVEEQPRPPQPTLASKWLKQIQERRRRKRRALEVSEDRQVDDILRRLHEGGMESLSPNERSLCAA